MSGLRPRVSFDTAPSSINAEQMMARRQRLMRPGRAWNSDRARQVRFGATVAAARWLANRQLCADSGRSRSGDRTD